MPRKKTLPLALQTPEAAEQLLEVLEQLRDIRPLTPEQAAHGAAFLSSASGHWEPVPALWSSAVSRWEPLPTGTSPAETLIITQWTDGSLWEYRALLFPDDSRKGLKSSINFVPVEASLTQPRAETIHALHEYLIALGARLTADHPKTDRPIPSTAPAPLMGGFGVIPSALPMMAILAALHDAEDGAQGFAETQVGLAFRYVTKRNEVQVSVRPPEGLTEGAVLEALWEQAKNLSDHDLDVLFACLMHWLYGSRHGGEATVWIKATDVLNYRGVKPITKLTQGGRRRHAGHREEDKQAIADAMNRLEGLWVTMANAVLYEEQPGKKVRQPTKHQLQSRIVQIEDRITQTALDGAQVPVAWHYAPGRTLRAYLEYPNVQTTRIACKVLEYDPNNQRWEKRLGQYFTFHLAIGARSSMPIRRCIGSLIEELRLPINKRDPQKTRGRFERAMNTIAQDRVIAQWSYASSEHRKLKSLPAKGWLSLWLDVLIDIAGAPPELSTTERTALLTPNH